MYKMMKYKIYDIYGYMHGRTLVFQHPLPYKKNKKSQDSKHSDIKMADNEGHNGSAP